MGAMFKKPKMPRTAEPKVVPMPVPDDQAAAQAKRKTLARQSTRGGRASTILTSGETLGGN